MADAITRWQPSARASQPLTVMSTDLNSLANSAAVLSAVLSNDQATELDLYCTFELNVTFAVAPTENSQVELYIVWAIDGTNYETNSSEGRPKNGYVGGFIVDNVTTAQRITVPNVLVPPMDFKIMVINKTGQAFPASGSTVKAFFFTTLADE
jgi:hypothetical protein